MTDIKEPTREQLEQSQRDAGIPHLPTIETCGGEGWVLVPREPTMAMMAAGADRVDDSMAHAVAVYRAMLASLPTQESEDGR